MQIMGNNCIKWLKVTDSTNSEANRNASSADDMSVWFAEYQTAGRGQKGNVWESGTGLNLTFSILLKPTNILATNQFIISQMVSAGIVDYLEGKGLDARIKWPNDIYVGNRKICGILIENRISGDKLSVSVVGIGLNLNQRVFSSDAPNPTSLVLELEREHSLGVSDLDVRSEMDVLLSHIFKGYIPVNENGGSSDIEERYHSLLYRLGEFHLFEELDSTGTNGGNMVVGKIIGVDKKTARLQLELEDGTIHSYAFKELKYHLSSGMGRLR